MTLTSEARGEPIVRGGITVETSRPKLLTLISLLVIGGCVLFSQLGCGGFFPKDTDITALTISPSNQTVAPGGTQQYTATATYGNDTSGDATNKVTWSSSVAGIATISASGLATVGSQLGTTTIAAKNESGSVIAKTGLTVSNATVDSVAVSPSSASIFTGQPQQLSASASYSNNSSVNVTNQASWSSSATSVATVSGSGVVTGIAPGTATVIASFGGQSGNSIITVQ